MSRARRMCSRTRYAACSRHLTMPPHYEPCFRACNRPLQHSMPAALPSAHDTWQDMIMQTTAALLLRSVRCSCATSVHQWHAAWRCLRAAGHRTPPPPRPAVWRQSSSRWPPGARAAFEWTCDSMCQALQEAAVLASRPLYHACVGLRHMLGLCQGRCKTIRKTRCY